MEPLGVREMSGVRRCPTCGGQGEDPEAIVTDIQRATYYAGTGDYGGASWVEPCPTCADMPWLPCVCDYAYQMGATAGQLHRKGCSGRFKPDPQTVERRCFTHDSTTSDKVACHRWNLQVALRRVAGLPTEGMKSDCDIGWVARPERLEVAE